MSPAVPCALPRIEDVVARWSDFIKAAGRDRRLLSALFKARPVSVEGDALVLMVSPAEVYGLGVLRAAFVLDAFRAATIDVWGAPMRPVVVDEVGPQPDPANPSQDAARPARPHVPSPKPAPSSVVGPAIRALPTHYKGVTFRSRLEARWAVFFDQLGIRWEYEPEGFNLPSGRNYLPDFYLPDHTVFGGNPGCWVEVKPKQEGFSKAIELARASDKPLWMAAGNPGSSSWFWIPDQSAKGCGEVQIGFLTSPDTKDAISAAISARFGT